MSVKRTIILSNDIDRSSKAILNLECEESKTFGEIRLFGVKNASQMAIGIKNGEKPVIKIPLSISQNLGRFSVSEVVDNKDKIFCALVDTTEKSSPKVVVSGCDYGADKINDVVEIAFLKSEKINKEEMYEIDENIEDVVLKNMQEDEKFEDSNKCVNCKYRQCFYNEVETQTNKEETEKIEKEEEKTFYDDIKLQIEDLFLKHSKERELEELIPNSKWIRVDYENGTSYYVLGLIYENEEIAYIAYGLPARDNSFPPEDLKEYAQWLPILNRTPDVSGYWLVYQSAKSGESVLINVI